MEREGFGRFVFLHNIKSSLFERIQELYWRRVLRDYMNSSKLMYVVIIFLNKKYINHKN